MVSFSNAERKHHVELVPLKGNISSQPSPNLPPSPTPANVLSQPVPGYLLPLDFLPGDRQLPAQGLEGALAEAREAAVQLLLVLLLYRRYLLDDGRASRRHRRRHRLISQQPHVTVLVVVHVDLNATLDSASSRIQDVE